MALNAAPVLLLDSGNTRLKVAIVEHGAIQSRMEFPLGDILSFTQLLESRRWKGIVVVNSGMDQFQLNQILSGQKTHFLQHNSSSLIQWAYPNPENLGKDRMAAMLGAAHDFPKKNCLVADAGTCLTLDVLRSDGVHLGGVISPGLGMRLISMHENTAHLPLGQKEDASDLWGNSTKSCLADGAVWGVIAEIEYHFQRFSARVSEPPILILTGGDADFLAQRLKVPNFVRTNLVFQGMIAVMAMLD